MIRTALSVEPVTVATAGQRHAPCPALENSRRGTAACELQQRLEAVLGAGRFHVVRWEGIAVPWLVAADRAPCQMPGEATIRLMLHGLAPELARWVRVQLLLGCGFRRSGMPPQRVYEQALALTEQNEPAGALTHAHWQALQLRVQHAWLQRMDPAMRLIGRYRLRAKVAALACRHAPVVRIIWLQVLRAWADEATDAIALPRHADAEALCDVLGQSPATRALGQRLLAECLLRRAGLAQGGHHSALLLRAAGAAHDALAHARDPATAALVCACIALARAERATPALAAQLHGQAADHLTLAAAEPALVTRVQQARRVIELAREATAAAPFGCALGGLAQQHRERQWTACELGAAEWIRTVEGRHRQGQHAQACMAAAHAIRQGRLHSALVTLWERASAAWGAQQLDAQARRHWQANARACLVASLQCQLHLAQA